MGKTADISLLVKASQAQAEGGTNNSAFMTPQAARQGDSTYTKYEFIGRFTDTTGTTSPLLIQNLQSFEEIIIEGWVRSLNSADMVLQCSVDNGLTFISAATDYTNVGWGTAGGAASFSNATSPFFYVTYAASINNDIYTNIKLMNFNKTRAIRGFGNTGGLNGGGSSFGAWNIMYYGEPATAVACNSFKIYPGTGSWMYDLKIHGIRG